MFGFLGRMFGSDKAGAAIIDNVSSGIDKIWYTEEEKAEDQAQAKREGMAVYMKWLESTSGSRVARRLIALMVTGIWVIEHLGAVMAGVGGIWADDPTKLNETSRMLADHATNNNTLVGVVLLFYFGGPAAIDASKGMIERWTSKDKK